MDQSHYLNIFQQAADKLDKSVLKKKQLEIATGIYLDSVFLKLYKTAWANKTPDPLTSGSRIFFSVWINDKAIDEERVLYNIHALKLRHLNGYAIASREFAAAFRKKFKRFEKQWPNVSTDLGPLTLMQGWNEAGATSVQNKTIGLAKQFLEIDHLIDDLLLHYKK